MGRVAAALLALVLSASVAHAEDFAEDFVTAFRLICLSKKPYTEAFEDAAKSGRLHKPVAVAHGATLASKRMRPIPKGYARDKGITEIPAYRVSFYKQMAGMASGGSCHVSTFGKIDDTDILRPLVDQLPELTQPPGSCQRRSAAASVARDRVSLILHGVY